MQFVDGEVEVRDKNAALVTQDTTAHLLQSVYYYTFLSFSKIKSSSPLTCGLNFDSVKLIFVLYVSVLTRLCRTLIIISTPQPRMASVAMPALLSGMIRRRGS